MSITTTHPTDHLDAELFDRLVARVSHDEDVDAELATRIVAETISFLRACAANPSAALVPSTAIDAGWHAFILHARDYATFCHRLAGRYIHHQPSDSPGGGAATDTVRVMRASGYDVDEELWPDAAKCRKDCEQGPKCHQCHAGCHDSP